MENNKAYRIALERIEACIAEKATTLDLSSLGLEEIPKEVEECVWIENLDLGDNQLSVIEYLEKLTKLRHLNIGRYSDRQINNEKWTDRLYENSINTITGLDTLLNLETLNLSNNQIRGISGLENLSKLVELNLHGNKIRVIDKLDSLTSLVTLYLGVNNISEIGGLNNLHFLKNLYLFYNQIIEITGLENLICLEELQLRDNKITEIKGLQKLVSLKKLHLGNNQIKKVYGLEFLKNLIELNLSHNAVDEINGLNKLENLRELYLANNRIQYIQGLETFTSLQTLNLQDNQIDQIKGLENLKSLHTLDLSGNQIRQISGLEELKSLKILNLSNNLIEQIDEINTLISLTEIILSENKIEDLDSLLPFTNFKYPDKYFDISNNPVMEKIPPEVVTSGWPVISDWLLARQKPAPFIRIAEVKLLLLGNTNVGKSNLQHYFETGSSAFEGETTHGIRYKILSNLVEGVNLNCWDFGGQEFYHATHQLFFSPGALHLVLWSNTDVTRDGRNPETCFDLNYWLRCIEQLIGWQKEDGEDDQRKGNKIDTLVCENKIDLINYKSTLLNQTGLQEAFSDLELSFAAINLKPLKYMDGLKELIREKVEKLVNKCPPFYADYLQKIRKSNKAFVLVEDVGSDDKDDTIERVERTMEVFNNMGLLLYFPTIIKDKVFTLPQVLLDLLYEKVLSNPKKNCISYDEIKNSVANNELKLSTEQVTGLLLHFDLVFQIPDEPEFYFIPQYLSAPSSFIDFFQRHQFNQANIRIASDNFLMNVAMLKVFGNYGRYVKNDNKQEHLFWKDGIVIEKDRMLLMVKFDRAKQCIELYPDNHHNNFALQKEVVKFILEIPYQKHIYQRKNQLVKKFNVAPSEIKVETKDNLSERGIISWYSSYFNVLISLDGKFFASWNTIAKQVEQGIFQVQPTYETFDENTKAFIVKKKTVSVFDYNKYLPEKDKGQMKKVFISYSKEDLRMVNKFIEHLSALQLDGKIAHWYCTELTAGSDWNHEIQEHFDAADIVCFMISPNFMKTKYIHEHEIKKAFERTEKGDKLIIVPIILDFCKWTTKVNNLGDFTALPYMVKPVADFQNENMAWYIIQECLRLMIEKDLNPTGEDFYSTQPLPKDVLQILVRIAEGRVDNNTL